VTISNPQEIATSECPAAVLYWLPWYPDHLTPEQRGAVQAHAAECSGCRHELEAISGVMEASESPAADSHYARVRARIEAAAPAPATAGPSPERRGFGWTSQAAAAALLLAVGATTAIGISRWMSAEPTYQTAEVSGQAGGLQVVFRPDASATEIAEALRRLGAQIVDGPSPLGVYRIELGSDASATEAAESLSSEGVAIFAEPETR
jgi:hypothetical protein